MDGVNPIGTKLLHLRLERNETQEQVADSIGISYVSLSRYETGQRMPKMDILSRLADHYGVTVDELLGREPVVSQESWDVDTAFGDMMKEDKFKVFARGMAKMSPEKRDNLLSGFLMMFKEDFDAKGNKK